MRHRPPRIYPRPCPRTRRPQIHAHPNRITPEQANITAEEQAVITRVQDILDTGLFVMTVCIGGVLLSVFMNHYFDKALKPHLEKIDDRITRYHDEEREWIRELREQIYRYQWDDLKGRLDSESRITDSIQMLSQRVWEEARQQQSV